MPLLRSSVCEVCFFSLCWFNEFWLLPWVGVRSLLVAIEKSSVVATVGGRERIYAAARYPGEAET